MLSKICTALTFVWLLTLLPVRTFGQESELKVFRIKPTRYVVGTVVSKTVDSILIRDLKSNRLVNLKSEQIVSIRDADSEKYLINYAGFGRYFAWLVKTHPQSKHFQSTIALAEDKAIYFEKESDRGIEIGQEFSISREGAIIKSPTSGEILGRARVKVAKAKVVSVDTKLCKCELVGAPVLAPKVGDLVEGKKKTVAVLPFSRIGKSEPERSLDLSNSILTSLAESGDINIIERLQIKKIIEEEKLGKSEFFEVASAKKAGTLLNADFVIIGSIGSGRVKDRDKLFVKMVETRTGKILIAKAREIKSSSPANASKHPPFQLNGKWVLRFKDGVVSNLEFKGGGTFSNSEKRGHFELGKWQYKSGKVFARIIRGNVELSYQFEPIGKGLKVQHVARNLVTNKVINTNTGEAVRQ